MTRRSKTKKTRNRRLRFESLENRRVLSAVSVSSANDAVDVNLNTISIPVITSPGGAGADGKISLREAVAAANNTPGTDEITFDSSVFGFGPGLVDTITLTAGELDITESVTIDALALANGITIDASGNDPTPNSTLDDSDPYELRLMDMQGLSANFDLDGDVDGADLMKWLR